MQRLLRTARWDAETVTGDIRGYVIENLGHADGVLICDENGFVKERHRIGGGSRRLGPKTHRERSESEGWPRRASPLTYFHSLTGK